jgi:hypothetical protein
MAANDNYTEHGYVPVAPVASLAKRVLVGRHCNAWLLLLLLRLLLARPLADIARCLILIGPAALLVCHARARAESRKELRLRRLECCGADNTRCRTPPAPLHNCTLPYME